ncbi:hypothetical protein EIN_411180 [Entamoeba invadens IP1]|uniref:Uncharacterized protein n=1 Tax=Entamoeba invadens IP1 TaxID=370355 RepID=A0A0A1U179_ENTIV|nr:hypothetical protein EIN_411180 [Entamoeba invadens IP1]ELP87765.1 hypothetical protein EIN_411180 [Entamoeba invadens IP1]|eukprot:XP_004254536.1 hypothetical protein EIN_411180 [Entamoeba invadens IP1]
MLWFWVVLLIQLSLDVAFWLSCKWVWSLSLYLDSFADNYFADHITVIYCFSVAVSLYVYQFIKAGSLENMFRMELNPSRTEVDYFGIHSTTVARIMWSFGVVLMYHSSFGLALWGGYIGVSLIATLVIEFEFVIPRFFLMEYSLVFGRARIFSHKEPSKEY